MASPSARLVGGLHAQVISLPLTCKALSLPFLSLLFWVPSHFWNNNSGSEVVNDDNGWVVDCARHTHTHPNKNSLCRHCSWQGSRGWGYLVKMEALKKEERKVSQTLCVTTAGPHHSSLVSICSAGAVPYTVTSACVCVTHHSNFSAPDISLNVLKISIITIYLPQLVF